MDGLSAPATQPVTALVTASPIPTHPDPWMVLRTLDSLEMLGLRDEPVVLAHDMPESGRMEPSYEGYLARLQDALDARGMSTARIVLRPTWGHLSGSVRHALAHVDTPYFLMVHHDFEFVRRIDLAGVLADVQEDPRLKHVRFNKRYTSRIYCDDANFLKAAGAPREDVEAARALFGAVVRRRHAYTRTPCWSDNNHLASLAYYEEVVLPEVPDGHAIEAVLMHHAWRDPERYGTYIFGEPDDPPVLHHLDGRGSVGPEPARSALPDDR